MGIIQHLVRPEPDLLEQLGNALALLAAGRQPWTLSGSPTISPAFMRGLREANGSWKMICIERRCVPQFGFAEIRNVLAVEPDAAAGRLDQPQHAARHRRFAAAGFADSPSVSPTPTEKLTPSTACTVPTLRRRTPPRTA